MEAVTHAGASVVYRKQRAQQLEIRPAPREASSPLFQRMARRRTHDGAALAFALLLVGTLLGLGVWMVIDVAEGVALAQYCNGQCIEVRR